MIRLRPPSPGSMAPIRATTRRSLLRPFAVAISWAAMTAPPLIADDHEAVDPAPMRAVLAADAYASGAKALMASVDRPALLASTASDGGLLITQVAPGSHAERFGIVPGSRLLALDDCHLPTHDYISYRSAIDDAYGRRLGGFFMFQETVGSCTEVGWRSAAPPAAAAPIPAPAAPEPAAGADHF